LWQACLQAPMFRFDIYLEGAYGKMQALFGLRNVPIFRFDICLPIFRFDICLFSEKELMASSNLFGRRRFQV
jgi:hypothetical protein